MQIGLIHYLIVSAIVFSMGLFAIIVRKHAILVLMGIELMLNAVNINFLAFAKYGGMNIEGHVAAIFVIILAAAEASIALAIILNIYQHFKHVNVDEIDSLKE